MSTQHRDSTLPDIPELGIKIPLAPLAIKAFSFVKKHCDTTTYNHAVRSAYWALIIAQKDPRFVDVDLGLVVVSCILHDMGWATSAELLSQDKRFEVDGANIAKAFLNEQGEKSQGDNQTGLWSEARLQRAWDAIALHATPSIAQHAAAEVALTSSGITADFLGPHLDLGSGPNLISVEEYRTVMKLFPRSGFTFEGLKRTMCGLCNAKPSTTYDNFVGDFGTRFGVDGKGSSQTEFAKEVERARPTNFFKMALDSLEALDKKILANDDEGVSTNE
ncbi:metal dependent phosphohydrolase [Ilyonectria robusta]|uniref:metal dependent phosphohydrolase n=1 Tax=Ilyonectria robusta TaxID=1079257 RepID=UPI001E8C9F5F|nr:metal dependent phosphohydrolase [Ilyonectria robusta]KAH8665463.1 metal dependent phosphohydrolase [Ilyonectria robusta]